VVRHSYVDRDWWALPGGRYKPSRESCEDAARRELREELEIQLASHPQVLFSCTSTLEGKRDTLTVLTATATSPDFTLSMELSEARWVEASLHELPADAPHSRWLMRALQAAVTSAD
jgi:8-oxo-dGTP diphosphatase